jgi:hypothetical protein
MRSHERIILPLDVSDIDQAQILVRMLALHMLESLRSALKLYILQWRAYLCPIQQQIIGWEEFAV